MATLGSATAVARLKVVQPGEGRAGGLAPGVGVIFKIDGPERDAVVKTYASTITCNCRRSMQMLPDPADHPVFRIEPTAT